MTLSQLWTAMRTLLFGDAQARHRAMHALDGTHSHPHLHVHGHGDGEEHAHFHDHPHEHTHPHDHAHES